MAEQTQTVTIKKIKSEIWKALRMKALAAGKSVSEVANQAFQQAVNGKAK